MDNKSSGIINEYILRRQSYLEHVDEEDIDVSIRIIGDMKAEIMQISYGMSTSDINILMRIAVDLCELKKKIESNLGVTKIQ